MARNAAGSTKNPSAGSDIAAVVDSIRAIVQTLRQSSRESEHRLGISAAQLYILQELANRPGQSINELAERTFTHQSSVSAVVTKLVERALASRSISRTDARRVLIFPTATGKAIAQSTPEGAQVRLARALRRMPRSDLRELCTHLRTLADVIQERESPSGPTRSRPADKAAARQRTA